MELKTLQWTEPSAPNESCRYNHCTAETPFGRFLITWKGWKENDWLFVEETPWGGYIHGDSLEDVKKQCEIEFKKRLMECFLVDGGR